MASLTKGPTAAVVPLPDSRASVGNHARSQNRSDALSRNDGRNSRLERSGRASHRNGAVTREPPKTFRRRRRLLHGMQSIFSRVTRRCDGMPCGRRCGAAKPRQTRREVVERADPHVASTTRGQLQLREIRRRARCFVAPNTRARAGRCAEAVALYTPRAASPRKQVPLARALHGAGARAARRKLGARTPDS